MKSFIAFLIESDEVNNRIDQVTSYMELKRKRIPLDSGDHLLASLDASKSPYANDFHGHGSKTIRGTVALSTKDSFTLTVTGELYPMVPFLDVNTGIIKGSRFGTHDVMISNGIGKFKNYTQTFYNCGSTLIDGTNFQGVNLETGEMSIYVNNIHF